MNTVKRARNSKADRKYSTGRPRKRIYYRRKKLPSNENDSSAPILTLKREISSSRESDRNTIQAQYQAHNGHRIIDLDLVFKVITKLVRCAICTGQVSIKETGIRGLGSMLNVVCINCKQLGAVSTCRLIGGQKTVYEVNQRSVLAMHMNGQGQAGLRTFREILDLPIPVEQSTYDEITNQLKFVSEEVAVRSMITAAGEELDATTDTYSEGGTRSIAVCGNSSCRKRDSSSLYGICRVVGAETAGKVLDMEAVSLDCNVCEQWEAKIGTPEHTQWSMQHESVCTANKTNNSANMEFEGMLRIFKRSTGRGMKYTSYIGDGESKTYLALVKARLYGNTAPVKVGYIGYVQKRMEYKLRKLRAMMAGKELADGRCLEGKRRLTDLAIEEMTSSYGDAIGMHINSASDMHRAIWAIWYHKNSSDFAAQHYYCSEGIGSWCEWQKTKANGNLSSFCHTESLQVVMAAIIPVFEDLTKPELRQRFLGIRMQNVNESFNTEVWKLCPKDTFQGLNTVRIALNITTETFNDGRKGLLRIMEGLEITPGIYARCSSEAINGNKIDTDEPDSTEEILETHTSKRSRQLQTMGDENAGEDTSYITEKL